MSDNKPEIFKNGTGFLYPTTEAGPSLYGLLEGVWSVAALVKGARIRIWEKASAGTPDPIAAAWARMGLLRATAEGDVVLTEAGHNILGCIDLLEYELAMLPRQLAAEIPPTDPAMYAQLRTGLREYANRFLRPMLEWAMQDAKAGSQMVLDYCGGSGPYARAAAQAGDNTVWLIDKALHPTDCEEFGHLGVTLRVGNVLEQPELTEDLAGFFDLIVMSEILHCQPEAGRAVMLQQCYNMLAPGGKLVVIEQIPTTRMEWRLRDMTKGGHTICKEQMAFEVQAHPLRPDGYIECISHYGISFKKDIA